MIHNISTIVTSNSDLQLAAVFPNHRYEERETFFKSLFDEPHHSNHLKKGEVIKIPTKDQFVIEKKIEQ